MIQLDVGVAYGSDVERVKVILLEAANAEEEVVKKAQTASLFNDFGESSLQFTVYFWIEKPFLRKLISSNIRFRIDEAFRANGIRIPFPQRDVHVHQAPAEAG